MDSLALQETVDRTASKVSRALVVSKARRVVMASLDQLVRMESLERTARMACMALQELLESLESQVTKVTLVIISKVNSRCTSTLSRGMWT